MEEEGFFVGVGSSSGGGAPVPRKVATNTPQKMTKAEKKSWWDSFKEALYFYKTAEPPPGTFDWRKKPSMKAPKCALKTPANYMPAGTIKWHGREWPAVWLNGSRYMLRQGDQQYYPPEFDDRGRMIEPPRFEKADQGWDPFVNLMQGAATAGVGYAAYKAGQQGGFVRGARAGYQLGRMQGVDQFVNPHIEPVD